MKTTVTIEWDKPQEQAWLCPENIAIALHAHCKNTEFKVTESLSQPTDEEIEEDAINKFTSYYDRGVFMGGAKWARAFNQEAIPDDDKTKITDGNYSRLEQAVKEASFAPIYPESKEAIPVPVDDLREAVQTLLDGIEFIKTEYNASYVITTPDITMLKQAMSSKETIPDRQPSPSGGDTAPSPELPVDEDIEDWIKLHLYEHGQPCTNNPAEAFRMGARIMRSKIKEVTKG